MLLTIIFREQRLPNILVHMHCIYIYGYDSEQFSRCVPLDRTLMHMQRFRARMHTLELITMDSAVCSVLEHAMR